MRNSVRLNSWEKLLMTNSLIFSETWVMYPSAIPGLSLFCDWLFFVYSGVPLETASSFFLFVNVAMILRTNLCQLCSYLFNKSGISSILREKVSNKQTVNDENLSTIPKRLQFICNMNSTSVSPFYTFSLAGNINVYAPIQSTNSEKFFDHTIYRGKHAESRVE